MMDGIYGSGGGGGKKQHTPVEAPDSLHSVAYAKIDDLVSEGPIQGLADGLKSIFFNETPLQNQDNTLNFKNVQVDWRLGDQAQSPIPGFGTVENEITVGVQLEQAQPWTQALSNTALDGVRIRISTPVMSKTDTTNGDVSGSSVQYAIDVATDGGAFQTVLQSAITGKTTSKYERSHRIDLPTATTGWTIRVRRITEDSTSATLQNNTFIESYTELVDAKLKYPNSAHITTIVDAEQFQAIPNRAFDLFGYNAVPVPTNYDPLERTYSGVWDGTFKPAWTDNPAWLFYLMATHPRFGLGNIVTPDHVNKWALYRIAQWCDQLVPDGFGGQEPRLTCNLFLQTQEDAYKVLQDLASIFRGVAFWAGGQINASADQPTDPSYLYTPANVVDGRFEYAGSGKRARHTVAMVSWNDPQDFYRPKVEYVEDLDGIARYGINQTDVIAIGATSRGQARRQGRAILTTERLETDMVTFRVGLDGAHGNGTVCAPGQVIAIADPLRAGRRNGGRVSSATASTITLDALPNPLPSTGTVLNVIGSDGRLMGRSISSIDESTRTITVSELFDTVPVKESIWAFDDPNALTAYFRVLSVTEDSDMVYTITALLNEPDKYDYIDFLDPIEPRVPTPTPVSELVQSVVVSKFNRKTNYNTETVIAADWPAATNAQQYEVQWRKDDNNWTPPVRQQEKHSEYPKAYPGSYLCKVSPIGANGKVRAPTYSNLFTWADDEAPPDAIGDIIGDVGDLGDRINQEIIDRLAGDAALAQQIIDEATARAQAIADEAQARIDGINAEAQARADAILNEQIAREAAIENEATIRQSEDESLAQAISQIVAGSGEQFDFTAIWYFDEDLEGWTGTGATVVDGWLRPGASGLVTSPALDSYAIDGSKYNYLKLRVRRVGAPTWQGLIQWRYVGEPAGYTHNMSIGEPVWDADNIVTVDVAEIAFTQTVNGIQLDLFTGDASNYVEYDWIAVGRPSPGASVAMVQEETTARIAGDTAEATQRNTLAVQLRGNYTGTDVAQLTQGLVYSERQARISGDEVIASDVSSLQARMPAGTGTLATEASVTQEATARASADAALSNRTTAIEARLPAGSGELATAAALDTLETEVTNLDNELTAQADRVTTLEAEISGAVPVVNPSFEGGVTGWGQNSDGTGGLPAGTSIDSTTGNAYSGRNYFRFNANSGSGRALFNVTQFPAKPGEVIRIRMQTMTAGPPNAGAQIRIGLRQRKTDGSFVNSYAPTKTSAGSTWTYANGVVEGAITMDNDTEFAQVLIYSQDLTANSIIVDAVEVDRPTISTQANAAAIAATNVTVSQQGSTISAHTSQLNSLEVEVDGKASATSVNALTARVDENEDTITAHSTDISQINATIGSQSAQITQIAQVSGSAANAAIPVANASFESNSGWSLPAGFSYFTYASARSGSRVLRIDSNAATDRSSINEARTPVSAGQKVRAGFRIRYGGSGQPNNLSTFSALVRAFDASGAVVSGSILTVGSITGANLTTTYQDVSGIYTVPAGAVSACLQIRAQDQAAGSAMIDDAYLEPMSGTEAEFLASVTLTLDVNDRITGYRITNDGTTGDFTIVADRFRIVQPSGGQRTEYSNGNWRVYDSSNVLRVRMGVWT